MTVGNVTAVGNAPLYVTELAARRAEWAGIRQAAIAGNIANANTPQYKTRDIAAFEADYARTRLNLERHDPRHMQLGAVEMHAEKVREGNAWDVTHSANTVSLDEELMKADETGRHHTLATSVMGAFHRMLLSSVSSQ
ncbi:MAG: flagellar basal body protein [Pseudomonadota bacterium]